jgi:hypothetical protein
MPARLLDDPLGIACVFSDGRRCRRTLGETASPQLARDLLSGLADLVHPHDTVNAAAIPARQLICLLADTATGIPADLAALICPARGSSVGLSSAASSTSTSGPHRSPGQGQWPSSGTPQVDAS